MSCLSHFLRKKGELDKKTIEGVLYTILDDIFNEMDADNSSECIRNETSKDEYTNLDGNKNLYYVISYDEICNRFIKEVDGATLSARTFECADFGKLTHDRLISRCKEVFGGLVQSIGRNKQKRRHWPLIRLLSRRQERVLRLILRLRF